MKRILATLLILTLIAANGLDTQTGELDLGFLETPPELAGFFSLAEGASTGGMETIKLATWNIQNFGQKKANDAAVMTEIAQMVEDYDIIAVQEISSLYEKSDVGCTRNEDSCPPVESNLTRHENCDLIRNSLEEYLNTAYGREYEFVFSDYVKDERYLFIYDSAKINLISAELMEDPEDSLPICDSKQNNTGKMLRQPFLGVFQADTFTFSLLTAHTSPSRNLEELEGLAYFFNQAELEGTPNIILLGDLNAECSYLDPSDTITLEGSEYIWAIDDSVDTTVSKTDCAYDRFIFKEDVNSHYTGIWGVNTNVTSSVSDHYLVWAEFSINEISSPPTGDLSGEQISGIFDQIVGLLGPAFELIGSLLGGIF